MTGRASVGGPASLRSAARIGRIPVTDVSPVVDGGARPVKSVVDEEFDVTATVFREGHEAVNATVVLTDPGGREHHQLMTRVNAGLDAWSATISADRAGRWQYRVEGWSDPYGSWHHDAVIKVGAGIDVDLMLEEGARVLERAVAEVERAPAQQRPLRDFVTAGPELAWLVERERALYGAWYELFPRSVGATRDEVTGVWASGTFASAAQRLSAVAAMGFDVVYLTPVHPIGRVNRKGPNNALIAADADPGSAYAIGSADGGHDAIHPDLGTFADFDAFVARARDLGLEVALDLALNCAPDHPWVSAHPEWFTRLADDSIAYAENPPKKYQDIYPLNFDNDPDGLYAELRRVVQVWLDHGVRIFRVDNPHTKPVNFWQWLIGEVRKTDPDVLFLAEAFTRPAMMHELGKVGFHQSYTYFTWRTEKTELTDYIVELAEAAHYMRPNFFVNTPDILHAYLQHGGPGAFAIRAVLAAMLTPAWGVYSGRCS